MPLKNAAASAVLLHFHKGWSPWPRVYVADAKRQARRAESLLAEPAMTQLLSAQAAQLSGDAQAATRYFTDMLAQGDTEFLGLRGLFNAGHEAG